jgi:hypothetical protein
MAASSRLLYGLDVASASSGSKRATFSLEIGRVDFRGVGRSRLKLP